MSAKISVSALSVSSAAPGLPCGGLPLARRVSPVLISSGRVRDHFPTKFNMSAIVTGSWKSEDIYPPSALTTYIQTAYSLAKSKFSAHRPISKGRLRSSEILQRKRRRLKLFSSLRGTKSVKQHIKLQ